MFGFEITFGMVVGSLSAAYSGVSGAFRANRTMEIKVEHLSSLNVKVDKLLSIAARLEFHAIRLQLPELRALLEKCAHHVGTTQAGLFWCDTHGSLSCKALLHKFEVYYGTCSESLRVLIDDVNAYINENLEDLKCARSLIDDLEYQAFLDQEKFLYDARVAEHHAQQFGKLEERVEKMQSAFWQPWNSCCVAGTHQAEFESI